jgi:hypothetical protein
MKKGRWVWALVILSVMALLFMKRLPYFVQNADRTEQATKDQSPDAGYEREKEGRRSPESVNDRGLSRNVSRIIYTRHAKCRMDCRNIDVAEVEEILQNGEINYGKSDLRSDPDPKYALEGRTPDGQNVRIVFANSPRGPVVITVIDLGKEWACNCT